MCDKGETEKDKWNDLTKDRQKGGDSKGHKKRIGYISDIKGGVCKRASGKPRDGMGRKMGDRNVRKTL